MCGIFGVVSKREIVPLVIDGLLRLEYRGYDSCGIVVLDKNQALAVRKGVGEVALVSREENFSELSGTCALGHTRWATHGRVSHANAHPHFDCGQNHAVIHNGIIENHAQLRTELERLGHHFHSETDTEVVPHLIEEELKRGGPLREAILRALKRLTGAYSIGVLSRAEPGVLYAARRESPLIVGLAADFTCFASDPLAFSHLTNRIIYLEDGELLAIAADGARICRIADGKPVERAPTVHHFESRDVSLGVFPDYMSKEIQENGLVARTALSIDRRQIDAVVTAIEKAKHTFLTGIGTSYYVAMMAQYAFSKLTGRFVPALSSDELPYLANFSPTEHVIAISQSGETYDTLKALRLARQHGATLSAVLNVPTSSMAREVNQFIDQRAGAEICVLSTKSTMSQLVILLRVALALAERNGRLDAAQLRAYYDELAALPPQLDRIWSSPHDTLRDCARRYSVIRNWFFLGRAFYHGLALEAALKFKEVTYCHAEGLPAGGLKHGTISLIDESMHSVMFLPGAQSHDLRTQCLGAVAEIRARGGTVIAFQPDGAGDPDNHFTVRIEHPDNGSLTNPLLALMQAQLFAYYTARALGRNVDKPRNLAKSVTVG
ncbi:MAG: glutamine--fructose-6-phosphate transaminase (isomerizing) [Planctomycetota bacterium]